MTSVVFDYGGTIAGFTSPGKSLQAVLQHELAAAIGESLDQRLAATLASAPEEQPDWRALWSAAFEDFQLPYVEELARAHLEVYLGESALYDFVPGVLAELKHCGVRVGLLADVVGPTDLHRRHLEEQGLADRFDAVVWSSDTGVRKPARAAFDAIAGELGELPSQMIMVGDSEEADIVPARALGWRTVRVYSSGAVPATSADLVARNRDLPTLLVGPRDALLRRLAGL